MTDAIEAAPAEETAAFAAMQKGEDQPGSDQLPKADTSVETTAEPGSKETEAPPVATVEPQNKVVPIQALDAERDKRKAAQESARLKDVDLADARARLKQIQEMQRGVLPDANEDPVAATKAVVEIIQQQRNEQVTLQQARDVLELSSQHEANYAREFPEYHDAVKYLHQQVVQEMMAFEGLTQTQANARAAVAAASIAQRALSQGINPAIPMLQLAQLRGWRPEAPAAVAAQAAPNPAPAAVATPSAAEQLLAQSAKTLETIAAGQQAARSGAGMRGGADTPPSLREIAELSNSDDPEDIKRVEAFWSSGNVKRAMR
jgi:hypothetical protein